MSKIIDQFLVPLFVVISILYVFNSLGNDCIKLNKIYHHTTDNDMLFEKGNLSFYFSGDPQMQEIKNKDGSNSLSIFFLPKVMISKGECEAMVGKLNSYNGCYKVAITETVEPAKGILLTFNFDHNKFAVSCERFDSIGLQKGIVFRLYDKDLIKRLEQVSNQPVLRTLWHTGKSPRIVIDPGHGGFDSGAVGCGGIQEKKICLSIGTIVSSLLKEHGCDVIMTRNGDFDRALDERTSYANNNNADFFVSIHANYSTRSEVMGIETFCLQPHLLTHYFSQLSKDENNFINRIRKQRASTAHTLAQSVQQHLCDAALHFNDELINRKVKYAVCQVLLGAQIPSILIEVGFISHQKEAILLASMEYQNSIAHSICKGIFAAIHS